MDSAFLIDREPELIVEAPKQIIEKATFQTYSERVNALGMAYYNPNLVSTDLGMFDPNESPEARKWYDSLDIQDREAVTEYGRSFDHGKKLVEKRKIDAANAIKMAEDPLFTQLGMSLWTGSLDIFNAIPMLGVGSKLYATGKLAGTIGVALESGIVGMTSSALSEAAIGAQGRVSDTEHAALWGFGGGAFLGAVGGALVGPSKATHAEALQSKPMEWFSQDPNPKTTNIPMDLAEGFKPMEIINTPGIIQQDMFYKLFGQSWFTSDVNIIHASKLDAIRKVAGELAAPTVSVRNPHTGEVMVIKGGTAEDLKYKYQGYYNMMTENIRGIHAKALDEGTFKGTLEEFEAVASAEFTKISNKQEIAVAKEMNDAITAKEAPILEEIKRLEAERDAEYWFVKEEGKWRPAKEGDDINSFPIEDTKTKKLTKKNKEKFDKEHLISQREELGKVREQVRNELYTKYEPKLDSTNPIHKYIEEVRGYYGKYLEAGKAQGHPEISQIPESRYYRPRHYNNDNLTKLTKEEATELYYQALKNHPNQAKLSEEQLRQAAAYVYTDAINADIQAMYGRRSYVVPETLPFGGALKKRQLKLDETKLGPLLDDRLVSGAGRYSYFMSGRFALGEKFGVNPKTGNPDFDSLLMKITEEASATGNKPNPKEIEALENTFRDIIGDLRLNQLSGTAGMKAARNLTAFQTLRVGGAFQLNQLIEIGSNIMMNGMANMIGSGRFGKSLRTASKMLYHRGGQTNDEVAHLMVNMGLLDTVTLPHKMGKLDDVEMGLNPDAIESTLHGATEFYHKWNGFRFFQAVLESQVGGAVIKQIQDLGKMSNISKADIARLARWGLSKADAKKLSKALDKHYNAREGKLDLDKWGTKEKDLFQYAVSRGIRESAIQGDSIHLPNWMKAPGAIQKLMTQFLRYPMIAHTTLISRGMREDQARMAGGIIGSIMTVMTLKYLEEQATIALGWKEDVDSKFDYFGPNRMEAIKYGLVYSSNYTAQFGLWQEGVNRGMVLAGMGELGSTYKYTTPTGAFAGPSLSMMDSVARFTRGMTEEGFTAKNAKILGTMMPFNNLIILKDGWKSYVDDNL